MTNQKSMVILTGPTAVGKTALSVKLAKKIGGEIISADSMQVYKYMDIGTAKIMPDEMDGVPHHLVDVLSPMDDFNIVLFQQMAKKAMDEIYAKGKIPVLVGGTGFYIQAVLYDIDFTESEEDSPYREELWTLARTEGEEVLHNMLKECDPKAAEEIHQNNVKRVIRALEFYKTTEGIIKSTEKIEKHCWINMVNPDMDEVEYISSTLGVERDFLCAALDEEESSRVEVEDSNHILMIIDIPIATESDGAVMYSTMPLGIIITEDNIITVCLKENSVISEPHIGSTVAMPFSKELTHRVSLPDVRKMRVVLS